MPKRQLTEEQKQALRDRLAKAREAKKATLARDDAAPPEPENEEHFAPPTFAAPANDNTPDGFRMFLDRVDDATRKLLSDVELRSIFDEQQRRAREERKAAARKRLMEDALHVAKVTEGLLPQAAQDEAQRRRRMNELVTFTVELPPTGENGEIGDIGIRFDQRIFLHGYTYTVTRGEYDSMREVMYRAAEGELMFAGKSRRYRQWLHGRGRSVDPRFHIDGAAA